MKPDLMSPPRARGRGASALPAALALACALACASAGVPARAQTTTVRIAGQEALAPKWVYLRNRVDGICPDMLAAIERIEPRLRFAGYRQSRSLPGLEAGLEDDSIDVACALTPSPRRRTIAEPVGPVVYVVRHRLVGRRADDASVRSIDDLVRMEALVVGQRGAVFTDRLKAAGVKVDDATDDNGVNLRKVLAGHGRFVDINEITLQHYLRNGDLERRLRILPPLLPEEPAYFWVSRKADPAIARLLGPALDKVQASGELARIYARYASQR
jgi:polar amino acid transport system substrate-binding protein